MDAAATVDAVPTLRPAFATSVPCFGRADEALCWRSEAATPVLGERPAAYFNLDMTGMVDAAYGPATK